ncbi:MAG: TolC family protein [Bdellovibrionales bacterium]|nr:TolC family protein [Bdellovibrionales bacterium]
MIKLFFLNIAFVSATAMASDKFTLTEYLEQVKKNSPEVQSTYLNVVSLEKRVDEADLVIAPVGYAAWNHSYDEKPTSNPSFQGTKSVADSILLGVKKETLFGLSADLSMDRTNYDFSDATALPEEKYTDSRISLKLNQSLWKNGFGEMARAENKAVKAAIRAELMAAKFKYRNLMIQAENTYWYLASLQQIVKLQQDNVDSAEKLSKWMAGRQKLNLVDDVESLQTQAALQARDLELQQSKDLLSQTRHQFYTLLGKAETAGEGDIELQPLPEKEWADQLKALKQTKHYREDFEALRAQAKAEEAKTVSMRSSLRPQLDLQASYSSNARDVKERDSYKEIEDFEQPTWTVGVKFSVPLDFGLMNRLKRGSESKIASSKLAYEQASFEEERTWDDLVRMRKEAQARFEKAVNLEKLRTKLVERERRRHRSGRTTTFQAITNEQDLASSQVLRIQSQLNLIRAHNQIKVFVEAL